MAGKENYAYNQKIKMAPAEILNELSSFTYKIFNI